MKSLAAEKKTRSRKAGEAGEPLTRDVLVSATALTVTLTDGRVISLPLTWYPRLMHGTPAERNHWELLGQGQGIHWPDLDEDLSTESLVAGRRSMESEKSLKRWLEYRSRGEKEPVLTLPLPDWAKQRLKGRKLA